MRQSTKEWKLERKNPNSRWIEEAIELLRLGALQLGQSRFKIELKVEDFNGCDSHRSHRGRCICWMGVEPNWDLNWWIKDVQMYSRRVYPVSRAPLVSA